MGFFAICIALLLYTVALSSAYLPNHPYKVYGNIWAWNNNYGDSNNSIRSTFGSDSTVSMTTTFSFSKFGVYGYPAMCRGWHYNENPVPSDTLFPIQVSKLSNIPVTLKYSSAGSNPVGDFAYDMFFRWDTIKSTPQLELMIWGDHNSLPIGKKTGSKVIKAAGRYFDLWEGLNTSTGYYVYSFVPINTVYTPGEKKLATRGSIDLDVKFFLDWLQTNRKERYSDSLYLHVIEAGFEVANGSGSITMSATINAS